MPKVFKWDDRRKQAALLLRKGHTIKDTAERIGVGRGTITEWKKHDEFKQEIAKPYSKILEEEVKSHVKEFVKGNPALNSALNTLNNGADAAAKVIVAMSRGELNGKGSQQQYTAAKDILDRLGVKAPEVIETRTRDYSPEEIQRASDTLREVESIMKRLDNSHSRYVLNPKEDMRPNSVIDAVQDAEVVTVDETEPQTDEPSGVRKDNSELDNRLLRARGATSPQHSNK